jgi:hypothetical protein
LDIYKAGDKWILGLSGGHIKGLQKGAEAVILKRYPNPVRMWRAKTVIEEQNEYGEFWEYDYTFKEHDGDDNSNIYFFEIASTRRVPDFVYGTIEYFVTEEYVKEKIAFLRNKKYLAEYIWDASKGTWIELYRDFKYEDEEDNEESNEWNLI